MNRHAAGRCRKGKSQGRGNRRPAAVLLVVLVCLMSVMILSLALARALVLQHRQLRVRENQLQALWLMESAVDRVHQRLGGGDVASSSYEGEQWRIPAEELGGLHSGRISIQVVAAEDSGTKSVEVIVEFPAEGSRKIRQQRSLVIVGRDARQEEVDP